MSEPSNASSFSVPTRRSAVARGLATVLAFLASVSAGHALAGPTVLSTRPVDERPPAAVVAPEETLLVPIGMTPGGFAGGAVAIDGETILVGVPGTPGGMSGQVFAYRRNAGVWELDDTLACPFPPLCSGASFGSSIALLGDTAVIGAPGGTSTNGAAYLYTYDSAAGAWRLPPVTLARPSESPVRFGYSVSISTDRIAVGAPGSGSSFSSPVGRVFVYDRAGLGVTAIRGEAYFVDGAALFGAAVAVAEGTVLVGAPSYDMPVSDVGAAFTFRFEAGLADAGPPDGGLPDGGRLDSPWAWVMMSALAPLSITDANFGRSVALTPDGRTALIGAPGSDPGMAIFDDAGEAFLYTRTSTTERWTTTPTRIVAEAPLRGAAFGWSVDLTDDGAWLAIGSRGYDEGGLDMAGAVYLVPGAGAPETARYMTTRGALGDRLGSSVAIFGTTVVGGAEGDGDQASYAAVFPVPEGMGARCSLAGRCLSGFCVDGFCCNVACGGDNVGDCVACSAALGVPGAANGTCGESRNGMECPPPCGTAMGTCSAGMCIPGEMCMVPPDAGPDDGGMGGMDTGPVRPPMVVRISGCRCGVGRASPTVGLAVLGLAIALAVAVRRRR